MTEEANKAIARQFYEEILNRGNLSLLDKCMAREFVDHGIPAGLPVGPEGFKQFVAFVTGIFPDLHVQVEDLIAEGDTVAARLTVGGTQRGSFQGFPPTGRQVSWTGMDFIRILRGRMVERWGERDFLGMLRKLGHLPAPE